MGDQSLSLAIANQPADVARAVEWAQKFCVESGGSDRIAHRFALALDEVLTNIVSYAFSDGGQHLIDVRIERKADGLHAAISDDGAAFNPLTREPANVRAPVEERDVGGLGIHLLRELTDELAYRRDGGRNVLTFRMKLGA